MNLTQEKALFFSQYLGQKIQYEIFLGDKAVLSIGKLIGISIDSDLIAHGSYDELLDLDLNEINLLLRSASQLTDEEARILEFASADHFIRCYGAYGDERFESEFIGIVRHTLLIRMGFIRPFTYLNEENKPVTLQPKEIIALGWAKINEA